MLRCALGLAMLAALGCGSKAAPATTTPVHTLPPAPAPLDTFAVSGLRGTLSQREIQGALEPRLPRFLRCVQPRLGELEVLSGSVSFAFHVATDGAVVAVHPRASELGDREAERCMTEVAAQTRFPPPHGGPADFSWSLEIPPDPDVRAAVALDGELARPLRAQAEQLIAQCGGGQTVVTAYVGVDGKVLSAGVAAPDGATDTQLDCIARGVREWQFESPGSYVGKLSFTVP